MQLHCTIKLLPFTNTLNPNHLSQLHQVQTFFFSYHLQVPCKFPTNFIQIFTFLLSTILQTKNNRGCFQNIKNNGLKKKKKIVKFKAPKGGKSLTLSSLIVSTVNLRKESKWEERDDVSNRMVRTPHRSLRSLSPRGRFRSAPRFRSPINSNCSGRMLLCVCVCLSNVFGCYSFLFV